MNAACRTDRGTLYGARTARILALCILALLLLLAPPALAAIDNGGEPTFEDRAAAEKMSRSRYRKLEVASLVIIFASAGAVYWAMRRRKP